MNETLLLTRRDVAALLPMPDCIAALEDGFRAQAEGRTVPSAVLGVHVAGGGFHVKAAGLERAGLRVAIKQNANFPANPERRGLPTIQGLVAVYDGEDGRLLAVMDSTEITALRTGAATGVAAKLMARPQAESLMLCGCGVQAGYQIRAVAAARRLRRVLVHDRDAVRARQLADRMADETGLSVMAVEDPRAAMRQSEMIVTCTPSREAIVALEDVVAGTFVAGVGADHPLKHELSPSLLAGSRLVVDSIDQAATLGDLHHAVEQGLLRREDVHAELWEIVAGHKPGRVSDGEITVFDSTGVGLEDVAAAALAYERALASGRGQRLAFGR
jgi:ornithine cyclodeaminase/alanine dehydrogenase-like protein (mu-crystallin family)